MNSAILGMTQVREAFERALEDNDAAIAEAESKIKDAERVGQAERERLSLLHEERHGVQLWLARHGGPQHKQAPSGEGTGKGSWSMTKWVLKILGEAERALSPAEIADSVPKRGVDSRQQQKLVSAALTYLKKKGQVEAVERGAWSLVRQPETVEEIPF